MLPLKYSILLAILLPHLALSCEIKADDFITFGKATQSHHGDPDPNSYTFAGFRDHDGNTTSVDKSARIVDVTPIDNYPWQVSVQWLDDYYDYRWYVCGGFILSERWIGTSALCVSGREDMPERHAIFSGSNDLRHDGYLSSVHQILVHSGYDYYTGRNDIAWIRLENALDLSGNTRRAIPIQEQGSVLKGRKKVEISGWGVIYNGGPFSEMLQSVGMRLVPQSKCRAAYRGRYGQDVKEYIDRSNVCAGLPNKNVCYGNWGDALVMRKQSSVVLVGIVSDVYICGEDDTPGIYTKMSEYTTLTKCVISK